MSDAVTIAKKLAASLEAENCEYALGGAIALGIWAVPRGTVDVDLTLFLPPDRPAICVRLLQKIGCEVQADPAARSLSEHGFCEVKLDGRRIDVFLPIVPFYETAKSRRQTVRFGEQSVKIWDAETLCVFKMMFFRRKDLADVEQVIRSRGAELDLAWVRQQILAMYGQRDPRLGQWDELVRDASAF
jgi:hypothetical protein